MKVIQYEVPAMDEFFLNGDPDGTVWMQCCKCLETWAVCNLGEAVHQWNEHVCLERKRNV